jgi:exonuclease I
MYVVLCVISPVLHDTKQNLLVIYDLKCLIDKILDALENCSDSLINQLQPLLGALLGHAVSTTCRSGVLLLDLCL